MRSTSILEDKSYQRHSCRARTHVLVNVGEQPIYVLGHVVRSGLVVCKRDHKVSRSSFLGKWLRFTYILYQSWGPSQWMTLVYTNESTSGTSGPRGVTSEDDPLNSHIPALYSNRARSSPQCKSLTESICTPSDE